MVNQDKLSISLDKIGEGSFALSGQLVFNTVSELLKKSNILIDDASHNNQIVIDCSSLSHMDSAGIALLLDWKQKTAAANKSIGFEKLPKQAKAIIHAARLSHILSVS